MAEIPSSIPSEYRPLSAWAYFGYSLLFNIPIIGFICLIIFSFDDSNINRRSYARSYFCVYALIAIMAVIAMCCGVSLYTLGKVMNI